MKGWLLGYRWLLWNDHQKTFSNKNKETFYIILFPTVHQFQGGLKDTNDNRNPVTYVVDDWQRNAKKIAAYDPKASGGRSS
jgi:hypothetical protein